MKVEIHVFLFTDIHLVPRTSLGHAVGTQIIFTEYRNELFAIVHPAQDVLLPSSTRHVFVLDTVDMKWSWRQRNHLIEPKKLC